MRDLSDGWWHQIFWNTDKYEYIPFLYGAYYIRALDIYIYDQNQTEPIQNEVDVSFPTIS